MLILLVCKEGKVKNGINNNSSTVTTPAVYYIVYQCLTTKYGYPPF